MNTISSSDFVYATATYGGRTIASISSTGFTSIADVLRAIAAAAGTIAGVVRLSLRNASRGWSQTRSLFITPPAEGVQLSLF